MSRYALVVFPIPADKPYCYRVPPALAGKVRRGSRVIAPFGGRYLEGYVIEELGEPNFPEEELKEIYDCLDEEPFFSDEMLELTRWMADRYISSWGEALRCADPYGVRAMIRRIASINEEAGVDLETVERLRKRASRQAAILEAVLSKGKASVAALRRKLGGAGFYSALSALERKGFVTISQAVRRSGPKRVSYVALAVSPEEAERHLGELEKQAPKAARALEMLIEEGSIPLSELLSRCDASRSSISTLQKRGLVKLERVEEMREPEERWEEKYPRNLELTDEQRAAFEAIAGAIRAGRHEVFLIHGVTGSGKTEVYMRAIEEVLSRGKGAIVLVPEISLTPQTAARFASRFGDQVAILHSRLSPGERFDQWRAIREGRARIVVGPRSAIFAPVEGLGLIVVDEEHETSYKQVDPPPRYHARDVAIKRGEIAGCPVVLGTATPSLESYYMAQTGRYRLLKLTKRVHDIALPPVEIVDMREELTVKRNRSIFSYRLKRRMQEALSAGHQVMLFLNRRGYSTYVFCRECGYVERCENCSVSLTYHRDRDVMICHHCGLEKPPPKWCPKCKSPYIRHFGIGTQQVEREVRKLFPKARVARMDTDAVAAKGAHSRILNAFRRGEIDVLVGTQMIAKGLDFPNVTLVGVVNADLALNMPDFRAGERAFNLLTQVAGRSGRSCKGGRVVVQTYSPEHYAILSAKDHDYEAFYRREIEVRKAVMYPPFTAVASILLRSPDEEAVKVSAYNLSDLMSELCAKEFPSVQIRGPAPAPLSKIRGKYRWHLLVKCVDRETLTRFLRRVLERVTPRIVSSGVDLVVDVDPISVL